MRALELCLILLVLMTASLRVLYAGRPSPGWFRYVLWILGGVTVSHLLLDGWRLQMLPAYVAVLGIVVLGYRPMGRMLVVFIGSCAALGAIVSGIAAYRFPVFTLPAPQGPYRVGTFVTHLVDHNRHERNSASPDAPRELMIQVWYPAQGAGGARADYRDPRMNTWRSNHLRLIHTHSYWDLPVADQPRRFNVLLFSPSSGGNRDQNTFEMEELASQGYVVVGLDHPYSSSRVAFPDGRVIRSIPWVDSSTQAAFDASLAKVEFMVKDHVADVRFVLDEMERWNQPGANHRLTTRLDLTKVGIIGHSFGGALAGAVCIADPRIAAGINMDGWMFGEPETSGIPKPFFFITGGDGKAPDSAQHAGLSTSLRIEREKELKYLQGMQASLRRFGGYHLSVLDADHFGFSDLILLSRPLPFLGPKKPDPYRVFQIVDAFTLAFFDRYIRDRPAPLLDGGGFRGEVLYEAYPASKITSAPDAIKPRS